jgi:hypothetical protein
MHSVFDMGELVWHICLNLRDWEDSGWPEDYYQSLYRMAQIKKSVWQSASPILWQQVPLYTLLHLFPPDLVALHNNCPHVR